MYYTRLLAVALSFPNCHIPFCPCGKCAEIKKTQNVTICWNSYWNIGCQNNWHILYVFLYRYATLVDPLMPQVTACLRDPDPQVHRTALTLLISLLQEDYLKLKGSFFYRILQVCWNEDSWWGIFMIVMYGMYSFHIVQSLLIMQWSGV